MFTSIIFQYYATNFASLINSEVARFLHFLSLSATYDIQDVFMATSTTEQSQPYIIKFANNSEARGVLCIMNYLGPYGPDMGHSKYFIVTKEEASRENVVKNLSGGKYSVMMFDIEGDGLVKSMKPAFEDYILVPGQVMLGKI